MVTATSTVDKDEIERFSRIAGEWWNPQGKFKPLHRMNPIRIGWIVEQISKRDVEMWRCGDVEKKDDRASSSYPHIPTSPHPLKGLRLLDIGCGGGLIAEPMARLGARVTAIDASEKNIAVARLHAERGGLEIDYRCAAVEELSAECTMLSAEKKNNSLLNAQHSALYDVVLALEIIEHVADVEAFVAASCALLKPGGLIIYSTLNRTAKSFALAILGAEYVCGLLPVGTHDWHKFLRPSELCAHLRHHHIEILEMTGMAMNPLTFEWRLDAGDLAVNYMVAGRKAI